MLATVKTSTRRPSPPAKIATGAKTKPKSRGLSAKTKGILAHLQPLPVEGPDAALLEHYNAFLKAWGDYYIDAETNREASVADADSIASEIVEMPAHTPQGMLLKIQVAGSQIGEVIGEFPFGGKDWRWDHTKDDLEQIEYRVLVQLRDDLRRLPNPAGVSPEIATLLDMWRVREAASKAATAARDAAHDRDIDLLVQEKLDDEEQGADYAENAIIKTIAYTRAQSLPDVLAKFRAVKGWAELEDCYHHMAADKASVTETMLWSICADLVALSEVEKADG